MWIALNVVQEGVKKNKQALHEYKYEFESSLKKNENEIKSLLKQIEKRYGLKNRQNSEIV